MIYYIIILSGFVLFVYFKYIEPTQDIDDIQNIKKTKYYLKSNKHITCVVEDIIFATSGDALLKLNVKISNGSKFKLKTNLFIFKTLWKKF